MRRLIVAVALLARPALADHGDPAKARQALAVIDGTQWTAATAASLRPLVHGAGYRIRRPERAYGAPHVVKHLRHAIAEVRALYPDLHTLAIGDISAEHGGKISAHVSHRKGLDVDVGFYFTTPPDGYPDRFAAAGSTLDLEATWALLVAFSRTTDLPDGVEIIFLDHAVQKRLYDYAKSKGTPDEELAFLLQYPRDADELVGLVRHWPNHADHFHVRFKAR